VQQLPEKHLTSVTTSESDCALAPCGDLTRGGGIPGMTLRRYVRRHDRHASDSSKGGRPSARSSMSAGGGCSQPARSVRQDGAVWRRSPGSREAHSAGSAARNNLSGLMEYSAPQIAGRDEPFRSSIREHLKGHTQGLEDLAIEMLARGLSVRDIEDAFKDESGRLLLSKTAVSQLGSGRGRITGPSPSAIEYEISYLFVDGIAERLCPGAKREPVLAAWGYTVEGRRVLLRICGRPQREALKG
jgi:hypothetical protein